MLRGTAEWIRAALRSTRFASIALLPGGLGAEVRLGVRRYWLFVVRGVRLPPGCVASSPEFASRPGPTDSLCKGAAVNSFSKSGLQPGRSLRAGGLRTSAPIQRLKRFGAKSSPRSGARMRGVRLSGLPRAFLPVTTSIVGCVQHGIVRPVPLNSGIDRQDGSGEQEGPEEQHAASTQK